MARFRSKRLYVMVTEEEYSEVKRKMESIGMKNMGAFVRMVLKHGRVYNINRSAFDSLVYEINKIGVNINQIAKKTNQTGSVYKSDVETMQEKIAYIESLIKSSYGLVCKTNGGDE